jgi:hypothetical protein
MCDSRWEYWSFLRDEERREDEARRPVEVVDERDVPDPEVEAEPEPGASSSTPERVSRRAAGLRRPRRLTDPPHGRRIELGSEGAIPRR